MARRGSFVFCFLFFIHTFSSRPWLKVYTEMADSVSWLDGLDWYGVECRSWFSVILDSCSPVVEQIDAFVPR